MRQPNERIRNSHIILSRCSYFLDLSYLFNDKILDVSSCEFSNALVMLVPHIYERHQTSLKRPVHFAHKCVNKPYSSYSLGVLRWFTIHS